MKSKKVIVFDLDGTLTVSKSSLSRDMAEVLGIVLARYKIAVISGGSYTQFQKQFIPYLRFDKELLENLYLFPTSGSAFYSYDIKNDDWKEVYNEVLTKNEKDLIINALKKIVSKYDLDNSKTYGDIIEDRGGQITFSALGQNAPINIKMEWDPNQKKRAKMIEDLKKEIPQFEIRVGGTTSIDITKKGLDKAYAIRKIKEILKVSDEDIIFVGDALYKGGNDEAVKSTGVDFIQESGPDATLEFLSRFM